MFWTITKPTTSTAQRVRLQWIADTMGASEKIAARIRITPNAVTAQAAQESSWGAARQGNFGLFGQKAGPGWTGLRVKCLTREFINGEYVTEEDWFRDYPSAEACLDDHFAFLDQNSRYRDAGVFDGLGDEHFFFALQKAGYATDPNYAKNLIAVEETLDHYYLPFLNASTGSAVPAPAPAPLLSIGDSGPFVTTAQTRLKAAGFYTSTIDGDFRHLTYDAVTKFQAAHHLTIDGVIFTETWKALVVV